jgi:Protein of unknown function (DUF2510)/Domain of unknown function (DUF4333)
MTDIITPQAGWYPDPTDSRAYRWWSGGAWTDHLTAAPSAESVWSTGEHAVLGADAFHLTDQGPSEFTSSFEQTWGDPVTQVSSGRNRSGIAMIVIGFIAVAAYLGSMAFGYTTIIPLVPGVIGLICAVPAFRRARVTGEGLAVSLLGVLLSGAATVLAVLPLIPMLLGVPSAAEVNQIDQVVSHTVSFHTTVEKQLIVDAQKDFGQTAKTASCPSTALMAAGSTFSCTMTLADGTTGIVNVTVTNDTGAFTAIRAAG